jgi:hypothetical protein
VCDTALHGGNKLKSDKLDQGRAYYKTNLAKEWIKTHRPDVWAAILDLAREKFPMDSGRNGVLANEARDTIKKLPGERK